VSKRRIAASELCGLSARLVDAPAGHSRRHDVITDQIAARGLDNRTGAFVAIETLRLLKEGDAPYADVYPVATVAAANTMVSPYWTVTAPPACFAYLPVSKVSGFPLMVGWERVTGW